MMNEEIIVEDLFPRYDDEFTVESNISRRHGFTLSRGAITKNKHGFLTVCRFADKASYGYGTSIPPLNSVEDENENENDVSSRKVIFCVHGKLSGCCTVIKGSSVNESPPPVYQENLTGTAQIKILIKMTRK